MILLEIALAVVLVWALACGSLILGGCISVCALSCGRARYKRLTLFVGRLPYYAAREKSELYLD